MICFYIGKLVYMMIDFVLLMMIPEALDPKDGSSYRDMVQSFWACLIWIPYFLKSVRVKNTFIN